MTTVKNRPPLVPVSHGKLLDWLIFISVNSFVGNISSNPEDDMTVEQYLQNQLDLMIKVSNVYCKYLCNCWP